MLKIVTDLNEWQTIRKRLQAGIGFVPTMGHLHEGHLSLCHQSKAQNDITVVSIFVNPTQFNQAHDFEKYPRTEAQDIANLEQANVDYLLLFAAKDLYHDNYELRVSEKNISTILEGEYRPGHFDGVLTIVLKLLNLVQAENAYFGEKDYQQLLLIKKLVSSFFIPTKIIGCATVRNANHLALSSRNSRLTPTQLLKAEVFARLLRSQSSTEEIKDQLTILGFKVDYIAEKWQRRLGAVWLDDIRLIDNVPLRR